MERSLIIENGETSPVVQDMKLKVNSFKEKLEVCQFANLVHNLLNQKKVKQRKGIDYVHNYQY